MGIICSPPVWIGLTDLPNSDFLDTKHVLKVYFKPSRKKIFCIFTSSNFAWPAPNSPLKVLFNFSPLHWFSKFNHFLGVCWFLGKIFANFVPPARKQFSDHHTQTFFLTEEARSHGGLWTRKVYFCVFYTQKYVYHQEIEKKNLTRRWDSSGLRKTS